MFRRVIPAEVSEDLGLPAFATSRANGAQSGPGQRRKRIVRGLAPGHAAVGSRNPLSVGDRHHKVQGAQNRGLGPVRPSDKGSGQKVQRQLSVASWSRSPAPSCPA
ncbi:hypothetical protein OY671_010928 [Metschnikowia pulcherrima]|nr:hypothetical protein OY671_010928 [Metschnikowia pulcherrima]